MIESLEDKLDAALDSLTMIVLRDKIYVEYERVKRRRGSKEYDSDSENEEKRPVCQDIQGKMPQVLKVWSQSS